MITSQKNFMEHLNTFNIISGIQNFTALLKSKDILIPVKHLEYVKCAATVILCVVLDIKMKISCTKEYSLLAHVKKVDH